MAIHNGIEARDADLSVRFKTISGDVDASGGLIFRYKNNRIRLPGYTTVRRPLTHVDYSIKLLP